MKRSTTRSAIINRRRPERRSNAAFCFVAVVCCSILVTGFFFAARQHFSSIDFGIKNSRLRRQIDELESERRRLLLAREVSLTPAEVRKAAKRIGLSDTPAASIGQSTAGGSITRTTTVMPIEGPAAAVRQTQPKVVATVISQPVLKSEKPAKQIERDVQTEKKDRPKSKPTA